MMKKEIKFRNMATTYTCTMYIPHYAVLFKPNPEQSAYS